MTSTKTTPAQAAARAAEWTAAERAAYRVGLDTASAFNFGYVHGQRDTAPYGDLSGRDLGGLVTALKLTGPGKPRTNAAYREMLAGYYRAGLVYGREVIATQWTEDDDEFLNDLAELGYDDQAES